MNRVQILSGWLVLAPALAGAVEVEVIAAPGRNFGYVIGDIVEQRFSVMTSGVLTLQDHYLPRPGPLAEGLELRHIEWKTRLDHQKTRHDFRLTYQVFKGVRQAERVELPVFTLHFAANPPLTVSSPVAGFTLSPLIPPNLPDEQVVIQNRSPVFDEPPANRQESLLHALGLLLSLSVLAYRAGRSRWYRKTPFDGLVSGFTARDIPPEKLRQCLQRIHAAFNQTAGYTLMTHGLDDFFLTHPTFKTLEADIRWFFQGSGQIFFGAGQAGQPQPSLDIARLHVLCQACARLLRESRR